MPFGATKTAKPIPIRTTPTTAATTIHTLVFFSTVEGYQKVESAFGRRELLTESRCLCKDSRN
jgi:hypothetical protein